MRRAVLALPPSSVQHASTQTRQAGCCESCRQDTVPARSAVRTTRAGSLSATLGVSWVKCEGALLPTHLPSQTRSARAVDLRRVPCSQ